MAAQSEKIWSRDYIIVVMASLGISFCNYFFFSTLPIYAQKLTGTTVYAGLVTTIYVYAALAVRPLSGILSDKYGRSRLLVLGAAICCAACFLYNYADGLMVLMLIRVLHGIGFGMHSTLGGAVAADVIPKSRMAEGIGYFGLYGAVAAAIAPGIALFIIGDGALDRFRLLFILAVIVSFASMILDCFITYEKNHNKEGFRGMTPTEKPAEGDHNLPKTFLGFEYAVFLPVLVNILLYVALSSVTSFIFLFALDRGLGHVGFFFTFNAIGTVLSRLSLGKVADRRGADVIVIPGILGLAISFALIPLVNTSPQLLLIAFLSGLAQGAVVPVMNTMMFERCSPQRRGTASAAFFASVDIGLGLGSIIFGIIAAYSYSCLYWGAMVCSVAALIVYCSGIVKKCRPDGLPHH
jgi:MFS family permease